MDSREQEIADFNAELAERLASLDRGERVTPQMVRERMEQRSRQKREEQMRQNGQTYLGLFPDV
jgi:hypothetical protein